MRSKSTCLFAMLLCMTLIIPALCVAQGTDKVISARGASLNALFVADEPIRVVYQVVLRHDVILDEEKLKTQELSPFTVESIALGRRKTIQQVRNMEFLLVRVSLRLDGEHLDGLYNVPPLEIPYSYPKVIESKNGSIRRVDVSDTILTKPIPIEKVSLYVETDLLHEICFIGDKNVQRMVIHADSKAELLNEFSPEKEQKGVVYLSTFKHEEPITVIYRSREETDFSNYRVIEYSYGFAVLDVPEKAFQVSYPPVLWRDKEQKDGEVLTVSPGITYMRVRSILPNRPEMEPFKGMIHDPLWMGVLLARVPTWTSIILASILGLYGTILLVRVLKRKPVRQYRYGDLDDEYNIPKHVFQTTFFHYVYLRILASRMEKMYANNPCKENCIALRDVLARFAVSRLKGDKRIDKKMATTMVASELRKIVGQNMTLVCDDIGLLENRLEIYENWPDKK